MVNDGDLSGESLVLWLMTETYQMNTCCFFLVNDGDLSGESLDLWLMTETYQVNPWFCGY